MRRVLAFGLSPFLIIATDSVLLIVLNTVLQRYGGPEQGDTLVTCATIVQSYLLIITMPMGGLTLGTQPVVSFNYGAGNLERIKKAIQVHRGPVPHLLRGDDGVHPHPVPGVCGPLHPQSGAGGAVGGLY